MRKMKKINGFLVVKFNNRELREWEGTALGNYGVIDEELYTGKLEIDRGSMEYDNIETIEEAVEMAHGLYTEEDYTEQPSAYAVIEEAGETVVERVTVEPQLMIDRWAKNLDEQIKSPHYPGVNVNTARHELYGFKVALTELGLLDSDACLVLPNAFGPEELQLHQEPEELLAYICDKVCKERIPGRTQEELDAVCAKCEVNRLAAAPTLAPPPELRDAFQHVGHGGSIAREIYALGLKLAEDCPLNDCHLYLNIFNICRELDKQIDRVEGWPRELLERELKRNYSDLKKMYISNYALRKYKHGQTSPASERAQKEPDAFEKPLGNQKSPVDGAVLVEVIPYREISEEEAKKFKDSLIKMIMSGGSSAAEPGLQSRKYHEEQTRKCLNDAEKRLSHFCLPPSLR